jgi:hypothetical protein
MVFSRPVLCVVGVLAFVCCAACNGLQASEAARGAEGYDARFVKMEVPARVLTDLVFLARITMRNTGAVPWTGIPYSDDPRRQPVLYSQSPERNKTWGIDFAYMGQGVEAGPSKEFTFVSHFKAPSTPGEYGFQWRLARRADDGRLVFFGEATDRRMLKVEQRPTPAARRTRQASDKKVLRFEDFEYVGSFKVPERVGEGGAGFSESGIALRKMKDGPKRLLVNFTHPRQTLFEVEVPPLVKFDNGDSKRLHTAQVKRVWGSLAMKTTGVEDLSQISPNGGLWWDEAQKTLYWTCYEGYWTGPPFPVLAATKLSDDGTVTHVGSWSLPKTVDKWKSYWGGVTRLSRGFAERYTGGRTMALGFGGYYSICAPCSRGPALAAIATPDPANRTLDLVELLSYADPAAAPRDGDYFFGLGTFWCDVPKGPDEGYWTMDDMCRGGVFIDLPDKHGYVAFVRLATGRIGYDYGAIGSSGACHAWYIYSPEELGQAAKGSKKPGQVAPWSITRVKYPGEGEAALRRAQEEGQAHASGLTAPVVGSCFDEEERLLYVVTPNAIAVGREWHPCVSVYRVKERS